MLHMNYAFRFLVVFTVTTLSITTIVQNWTIHNQLTSTDLVTNNESTPRIVPESINHIKYGSKFDVVLSALGGAALPHAALLNIISIRTASPDTKIKIFVSPSFLKQSRDRALHFGVGMVEIVSCQNLHKPYTSTQFYCFHQELKNNLASYNNIAVLDLTNSWMLQNIFSHIQGRVYVVAVPAHEPLVSHTQDNRRITQCHAYRDDIWTDIKHNSTIDVGVIFGRGMWVQAFLALFVLELKKTRCHPETVINVMVRGHMFDFVPITVWTYESGPVLSMTDTTMSIPTNTAILHTTDHQSTHRIMKPWINRYALYAEFVDVLNSEENAAVRNIIKRTVFALKRGKVDYVMDGGSLVGTAINHRRILWDDDIDIYIRIEDKAKAISSLSEFGLQTVPSHNGLYEKIFDPDNSIRHWTWYGSYTWPFIDIGWLASNETHVWESGPHHPERPVSQHFYPKSVMYPSTWNTFEGYAVRVPADTEAFLRQRFGGGWRHKCVKSNWNHQYERVRNSALGDGTALLVLENCSNILPWLQ